jgi:phenylalanyl-tRNA synthetase beta chain
VSVHDSERILDFFDLKGDLETLLGLFEIPGIEFETASCAHYEADQSGRFALRGETLVVFGRLNREFERDYKLRQPSWIAEMEFEKLLAFPLRSGAFHAFSKFPAVERDFSLVVPQAVTYAHLEAALKRVPVEEIKSYRPVDYFRGGSIPDGHYSLLLRVTFQSPAHTMTSAEISAAGQNAMAALEALGVRLRS